MARSRGIALVLGVQSPAQLEELYGRYGAEIIRTNCVTKIALHGLDTDRAEAFSRALGDATIQQEVQQRRPEGWLATSYSYAEQHSPRRLLTADEVRRIGSDERWSSCPTCGLSAPRAPAGASRPQRPSRSRWARSWPWRGHRGRHRGRS